MHKINKKMHRFNMSMLLQVTTTNGQLLFSGFKNETKNFDCKVPTTYTGKSYECPQIGLWCV